VNAVVLALVAAAGYGLADFVGGMASRKINVYRVVTISYPVGLIGLFLLAPLAGGSLHLDGVVYGVLGGALNGLAVVWFYAALASGPMSVVSPLTALLVAGLPLAIGMASGEHLGTIALIGVALAVVAVLLVSKEKKHPGQKLAFTKKVAWLTFGSGLAFALYFVVIRHAASDNGIWTLVVMRATASVIMIGMAFKAGQVVKPNFTTERAAVGLAVGAGVLDIVGNVGFVYAGRAGLLSIVAVLTSLYPAATVLLARLVLKERTGRVQQVGFALAAASVALIAVAS
jgi:drug/metabolite transporter (DMT)-like permease